MSLKSIVLLACLLCSAASAWGAEASTEFNPFTLGGKPNPIPEGVAISFRIAKRSYAFGETVNLTFVLSNASKTPFHYAWESQPDRQITATDEKGSVVAQWSESDNSIDGLIQMGKVDPGKSVEQHCSLDFYPHIRRAGRYTLEITPDCRWTAQPGQKPPSGNIVIDIREPTAKEAAAYVKSLCQQADGEDCQLLASLGYPGYLPELRRQAAHGSVAAVRGIGGIENTNATEALIELAQSKSPVVSSAAGEELLGRLPTRPGMPYSQALRAEDSNQILKNCWNEKLREPVLALAQRFLIAEDVAKQSTGAWMVASLGRTSEMDWLEDAIQVEFDSWQKIKLPLRAEPSQESSLAIPEEPGALPTLFQAVDALRERGYRTSLSGDVVPDQALHETDEVTQALKQRRLQLRMRKYAGNLAIFFRQLADPKIHRSDGAEWKKVVRQAFEGDNPTLARLALLALPQPFPDEWAPLVMKCLESRDASMTAIACDLAGTSNRKEFIKPLVQQVEVAKNVWLARAASNAAWKLGARRELWSAWVERLIDPAMCDSQVLMDVIAEVNSRETSGGGFDGDLSLNDRFELRERWREFLRDHGAELASGKRFSYRDPLIKPLMVRPRDDRPIFRIGFKNGTSWPEYPKR